MEEILIGLLGPLWRKFAVGDDIMLSNVVLVKFLVAFDSFGDFRGGGVVHICITLPPFFAYFAFFAVQTYLPLDIAVESAIN